MQVPRERGGSFGKPPLQSAELGRRPGAGLKKRDACDHSGCDSPSPRPEARERPTDWRGQLGVTGRPAPPAVGRAPVADRPATPSPSWELLLRAVAFVAMAPFFIGASGAGSLAAALRPGKLCRAVAFAAMAPFFIGASGAGSLAAALRPGKLCRAVAFIAMAPFFIGASGVQALPSPAQLCRAVASVALAPAYLTQRTVATGV